MCHLSFLVNVAYVAYVFTKSVHFADMWHVYMYICTVPYVIQGTKVLYLL